MAVLYGLLNEQDLAAQRVTTVGVRQVFDAIDQSVAEHDRVMASLMGLFTRPTTEFQVQYETAASIRLQPLDNSGRARPVKFSGSYTVGLPLNQAGAAWGHDYVTGVKMTVGEAARITSAMLDADSRWMRDHLLAALFVDGSYTFTDPARGALTVYGPASGDSTLYQIMSGADSADTDDHVKGTAAIAAATFSDIYDELREHPENGDGEVITFISTADQSAVEGLTGFYPVSDANLRNGLGVTELVGSLGVATPGDLIGYIEKNWVYVWRGMPANYTISLALGGEKPLAMRQDEEVELQGFKRVAERNDHPWYEEQWLRRAGFGAWNRVGAVVYKTNNATYSVPTGYTSPMP